MNWDRNSSKIHGIEKNGKCIKCHRDGTGGLCFCCCVIYNFGMKPNCGIYKIKIKIDTICGGIGGLGNIIGIVSQKIDGRNWFTSAENVYIGWGASHQSSSIIPYGLLCGSHNKNNIFLKNKFSYVSNNNNYKERLPCLASGDIVVLSYASNSRILSFSKENDNGKLNACIKNLPSNTVFYWFVGHAIGKMSMTIAN